MLVIDGKSNWPGVHCSKQVKRVASKESSHGSVVNVLTLSLATDATKKLPQNRCLHIFHFIRLIPTVRKDDRNFLLVQYKNCILIQQVIEKFFIIQECIISRPYKR